MADQVLDCKGLRCPMPIVKISKAIKQLSAGQTLGVSATDGAFKADVYAWAKKTKNEVVAFKLQDDVQKVLIRKS